MRSRRRSLPPVPAGVVAEPATVSTGAAAMNRVSGRTGATQTPTARPCASDRARARGVGARGGAPFRRGRPASWAPLTRQLDPSRPGGTIERRPADGARSLPRAPGRPSLRPAWDAPYPPGNARAGHDSPSTVPHPVAPLLESTGPGAERTDAWTRDPTRRYGWKGSPSPSCSHGTSRLTMRRAPASGSRSCSGAITRRSSAGACGSRATATTPTTSRRPSSRGPIATCPPSAGNRRSRPGSTPSRGASA